MIKVFNTVTTYKRLRLHLILPVIIVLTGLIISGCEQERTTSREQEGHVISDMLGREVELPETVNSVISLRAGALRMLTYLDAVEYAVAIEEPERVAVRPYLMARPEIRDLPSAGPLMGGDPELIVAADPDVIFMTFTTTGQADDFQARTGIPVVALDYGDFSLRLDTFFDSLHLMASILGKENRAKALKAYVTESLQELERKTYGLSDEERPRVYIGGISYSGSRGISSTEPYYPPFRYVGARNVAQEIDERLVNPVRGTFIDKEQIIIWNPDVIFVDFAGLNLSRSEISPGSPLYSSITALQNGRVYGVFPYNNYAANYENILVNTWYVACVLYPELFQDLVLREKVDEIFEQFLGTSVYENLTGEWGELRSIEQELL